MRTQRKEIPMKIIKPSRTQRIVAWIKFAYYSNKNALVR